jgi:hypothetical protein
MSLYVSSTSTSYADVFKHKPEIITRDINGSTMGYVKWKVIGSATAGASLTVKLTHALGSTTVSIAGTGVDTITQSEVVLNQPVYSESLATSDGKRTALDNSVNVQIKSSTGAEVRLYGITIVESGQPNVTFEVKELAGPISDLWAIDVYEGTLYFNTYTPSTAAGKIYSLANSGAEEPVELITGLQNCTGIQTDGTYLWYNHHDPVPEGGDEGMYHSDMDGTNETLIQYWYWGWNSYFEIDDTYLWFFNDYGGGSIETIPIHGGTKTWRCTAPVGSIAIAQDNAYVYYVDNSYNHFYRFAKPGGTRAEVFQVDEINDISDITVDADYIYYGKYNGDICKLSLSTFTETMITNISGGAFRGLCNDTLYIYVCDAGNSKIWRITKTA